MIKRTEKGKLSLSMLDLQIFFGELFECCNNEKEVEWLQEQLVGCAENIAAERIEEI